MSSDTPSSPFYGASKLDLLATEDQVRATISNYFAPFKDDANVDVVGMKEIKFKDNPEELVAYLEFLEKMFPEPLFVFLWRDHDEVLNSGWWKTEDRVRATAVLELMESESQKFSQDRQNCFTLTYADLALTATKLHKLFEFIGAAFEPEKLHQVLQIPHSYAPQKDDVRDIFRKSQGSD